MPFYNFCFEGGFEGFHGCAAIVGKPVRVDETDAGEFLIHFKWSGVIERDYGNLYERQIVLYQQFRKQMFMDLYMHDPSFDHYK